MFKYNIGDQVKVRCSTDFTITIISREYKETSNGVVIRYEGRYYHDPKVEFRTVQIREEELE